MIIFYSFELTINEIIHTEISFPDFTNLSKLKSLVYDPVSWEHEILDSPLTALPDSFSCLVSLEILKVLFCSNILIFSFKV
jgi:hypothetical protein